MSQERCDIMGFLGIMVQLLLGFGAFLTLISNHLFYLYKSQKTYRETQEIVENLGIRCFKIRSIVTFCTRLKCLFF